MCPISLKAVLLMIGMPHVSPDTEAGQSRDVWYILTQIDESLNKMKRKKIFEFQTRKIPLKH